MSIEKKIKEINKIGNEVSNALNTLEKEDLDVALFTVLQRQTHEHETLRITKHQLLEIVRAVNKL
tara:strand:+ start:4449 stop:4643 length:195 start_codon:yes stop_codon:yes gene_type:complete